jgi:hypothetical protein
VCCTNGCNITVFLRTEEYQQDVNTQERCEISGSHGGEYGDGCQKAANFIRMMISVFLTVKVQVFDTANFGPSLFDLISNNKNI